MTSFVVVVDPSAERRARFLESVEQAIAPVDGLTTGRCVAGDFHTVWASFPKTPISQIEDDHGAAVIWGEAISESESERHDATQLRHLWTRSADKPAVFDGFYAAVVYRRDSDLLAGADILGLFPIYYVSFTDVLLVSSSPELMRHHPLVHQTLNPRGLVGLLLTNGLFEGQTLWHDVRRLSAGHILHWQAAKDPVEIEHYTIPVSTRFFSLPFSAVTQRLDQVLDDAIVRHAPANGSYSLLLSGGLDSRMIGGYLRKHDNHVSALTSGASTDIELACASRVAHELGFEHHAADVEPTEHPMCAELMMKWEHLAAGFSMIRDWSLYPHLRSLAAHAVTGLLGDAIVGGSHIDWAYSPSSQDMSFETFFSSINTWGIQPDTLKKLLRRDVFGDVVDEVVNRIKVVYESYAEHESQRAWLFDLHHRQRFHVGQAAWRFSFGAWPILPVVDRGVLEAVGGMPAAALAERRAQISLVCQRFPELARLPLDRSNYDNRPIQPRIRNQLVWYVKNRGEPYRRRLLSLTGGHNVENRYVYRILDFNGPGWKAVRKQAEPYRRRLLDLFVKSEFERLLPPPDVDVHFAEELSGPSGLRILLGLALFSKERLG